MSAIQVFTMYSIKKGFNQDKGVRYVAGVSHSAAEEIILSSCDYDMMPMTVHHTLEDTTCASIT